MVIVYNSNTGTTKKYAEALASRLSCEAVEASKAGEITDDVIFMSWVMMNEISGLSDARAKYNLKMVTATGCLSLKEKGKEELISKNNITEKFVLLPGAFSVKNLTGMYKMMMKMALNMMKGQLKNSKDPMDAKVLEMMEEGIDLYDESKLDEVEELLNGDE